MIPKLDRPQTTESGWTAEHVEECSTLVGKKAHDIDESSMQNRDNGDKALKTGFSSLQRNDTFEDQ